MVLRLVLALSILFSGLARAEEERQEELLPKCRLR